MTLSKLAVALLVGCPLAGAVGCQAGPSAADADPAVRSDVTDIHRSPAVTVAYAPPVYDESGLIPTAPQAVSAPSPAVPASTVVSALPVARRTAAVVPPIHHTHTVRRGETLFAIAKSTYGDGRQWHRLAVANPAAASTPLRVGEQIVIP